jgi:transposase
MITAMQRSSGFPLMFRIVPGDVAFVSSLSRTIILLSEYGMHADLSLVDAIEDPEDLIEQFTRAGIDFVMQLSEKNQNLYNDLLKKGQADLLKKENLVIFEDHRVFIRRIECTVGKDHYPAYAYLGLDAEGSCDINQQALTSSGEKASSIDLMLNPSDPSWVFILISAVPLDTREIPEIWQMRRQVEQEFSLSKGISRLPPLRIQPDQRAFGHLLLCQIAATIHLAIQKNIYPVCEDPEEMFMALRNQKCEVFADRIVPSKGQRDVIQLYKKLRIEVPISFKRQKNQWTVSEIMPCSPEDHA